MYKNFYHLQRRPFEITPDPAFLFSSTGHNEALASLFYGVTERRGFVVLTGEVGTGKTLIVRALLGLLQRLNVAFALIFNPSLTPLEFVRYIASDFGLKTRRRAKDEIIHDLNEYLVRRHEQGLTTVLVVDEAHLLSPELLEEIRLLTNLETAQGKLLQIVMAGQPELDQKLDSFELRQLKQRVALRCRLDALDLEESRRYIERRLEIGGATPANGIFSEAAALAVFRHSKGIPRLINTICENALLTGYAKDTRIITPEMIDDVAKDLQLGMISNRPKKSANLAPPRLGAELSLALRLLLELQQRMKEAAPEVPSPITNELVKHEPYI